MAARHVPTLQRRVTCLGIAWIGVMARGVRQPDIIVGDGFQTSILSQIGTSHQRSPKKIARAGSLLLLALGTSTSPNPQSPCTAAAAAVQPPSPTTPERPGVPRYSDPHALSTEIATTCETTWVARSFHYLTYSSSMLDYGLTRPRTCLLRRPWGTAPKAALGPAHISR